MWFQTWNNSKDKIDNLKILFIKKKYYLDNVKIWESDIDQKIDHEMLTFPLLIPLKSPTTWLSA